MRYGQMNWGTLFQQMLLTFYDSHSPLVWNGEEIERVQATHGVWDVRVVALWC